MKDREITINNCPNCDGNAFFGMGENETPYGVLFAGEVDKSGNVKPNMDKQLPLLPVTCLNCGLVLFFNPKKP